MIITETTVPDITSENLQSSKISLAENIINEIYPLFDDIFIGKKGRVEDLKHKLRSQNAKLQSEKAEIETVITQYKRQKKISKLLERLDRLVSSGLVYDASLKHEVIVLLKILPKLSDEKIDEHLNKTLQLIQKRFSR